ncbi:MAG: electron transfer flavoprotein subunit alpha/FixB family protein [Solirubrobacterales bacterium]
MSSIMVVAETRRGQLRDVSLELIGAALELREASGMPVAVAIVDAAADRLAAAIPAEVDEVLMVRSPREHFEAHVHQRALEHLLEEERPALVLLGHTVDSLGFAPAVAAAARTGFASDVTAVAWSEGPRATRGAFGEKLVVDLAFPEHDRVLLTLRPGAFPAVPASASPPPARSVEVDLATAAASEHLGFEEAQQAEVDITKAPLLLSIGRGMDDEEELPRFEALATKLGGTLSVSRPLVDSGWVASARQVGQSGKTVKPRVYLALGISGAVQHLAGIRDAETVVAVNSDPEAPIFAVADFGAIADLFDVADALEASYE